MVRNLRLPALFALGAVLVSSCTSNTAESDDGHSAGSSGSPVESSDLTDDERRAIAEANAGLASSLGIDDPPDVDIIRMISPEDWAPTVVNCLIESGYEASVTSDGQSVDLSVNIEQSEAANLALYTCRAQYPVDPAQSGPLTDEQKERFTVYVRETLVQCIAEEGYEIEDIPSVETFISGLEEDRPWNPYMELEYLTQSDLEVVLASCPPNPPPSVLYGS